MSLKDAMQKIILLQLRIEEFSKLASAMQKQAEGLERASRELQAWADGAATQSARTQAQPEL